MRKKGLLAVIVIAAALSGCVPFAGASNSSTQTDRTTTVPEPVADPGPVLPPGFRDAGGGIAYRSMETGTELTDCSFYDSCVGVYIYSYEGCPTGGYIEANVLNAAGTIVTFTNDTIPTMAQGDTYASILGTVGQGSNLTYRLTKLDCY